MEGRMGEWVLLESSEFQEDAVLSWNTPRVPWLAIDRAIPTFLESAPPGSPWGLLGLAPHRPFQVRTCLP
jgi:hypothetical protein